MEDYADLDRYRDMLGQLPMLQVYAHILYYFPTPDNMSREEIIKSLEDAVTKVREKVPWMGARVINVGKEPGNSGLYRVIQCPQPERPIEVKDLVVTAPSYASIKHSKAPVSMIDTKSLTPVSGFPQVFEDTDSNPAHVVRLQASFIDGGLVVDFVIHHNMVDAGGHFGFVKLVAMSMRGEEYPESILQEANRDRRNIVPLLGKETPMLDHSHHRRPPITETAVLVTPTREPVRYHIFRFTAKKMKQLKALASQSDGFDTSVPYITTDDALCAFCWQRLAKLRVHKFPPETQSRFSRALDGRPPLGISPDYMGDVIHNVAAWMTFQELTESTLSAIASHLRRRLNETNTAYHIRSFATLLAQEPDKSTITYSGRFNPATDIGCSSIRARTDLFPLFGKLGKPEFIRRPPTVPFPSLVIFFPGNEAGDCDAMICLIDAEFEMLNTDASWNEYVEYIG